MPNERIQEDSQRAPLPSSSASSVRMPSSSSLEHTIRKHIGLDDETRNHMKRRSSPIDDLCYLGLLLRANQVKNVIEIGTFLGQSACFLGPCITGKYVTINKQGAETAIAKENLQKYGVRNVDCRVGDSLAVLPGIIEEMGGDFDAIYIDGWHSYKYSMAEYALAEPYLRQRPAAVAIFDDANDVHPDSGGDGGVPRAVAEAEATPVTFLGNRIALRAFGTFRML